jgi:hypothetical protein
VHNSVRKKKRFFYLKCEGAVTKKTSFSGKIVCSGISQLIGVVSFFC